MAPTRVLLADDHPSLRAGLWQRLAQEPDLFGVGEACDGAEALRLVEALRPDVLVLDMEMPRVSGVEVMTRLHETGSAVRVLALTAHGEEHYVTALLDRGAAGYLLKHESLDTIVDAIRSVAAGEEGWLSRGASAALMKRARARLHAEASPLELLSERELQVLTRMGQGLSNQQIAAALYISENTVKKHVNAIYAKLDLASRASVVAWAWQHGLVQHGA